MDEKRAAPPFFFANITRTTSTSAGGSGSIILGKYQLNHLLGRGSFAKVYHAQRLEDGDFVAIKVMDKRKVTTNPDMEQRIIHEVSSMHKLNHHPNIIKLIEVLATKSKIYLIMELAPGGDLLSKLSLRGRFSYSTARFYFYPLVSALHFCHQNGVAHRDIKPQNLLLDKDGQIKVSDFGLSSLSEEFSNSLLHTACGTPAYAAPEIVYRKGYDGAQADAWSCGVLLFVFLTGKLPFDDSSFTNMQLAKHRRKYQIPDCVQKPARSIIERLLDPSPTTRLSIEELMNLSWFKRSALKGDNVNQQQIEQEIFEKECKNLGRLNAFDLISMSYGLNLSGLFESGSSKKEMRFTTSADIGCIEEKLMKVGKEEGYRVERTKGGGIVLVKGRVVLLVEIWEMATDLWLVEVKVVNGGQEFDESQWEGLKVGLKDIVVSWYNDDGS